MLPGGKNFGLQLTASELFIPVLGPSNEAIYDVCRACELHRFVSALGKAPQKPRKRPSCCT